MFKKSLLVYIILKTSQLLANDQADILAKSLPTPDRKNIKVLVSNPSGDDVFCDWLRATITLSSTNGETSFEDLMEFKDITIEAGKRKILVGDSGYVEELEDLFGEELKISSTSLPTFECIFSSTNKKVEIDISTSQFMGTMDAQIFIGPKSRYVYSSFRNGALVVQYDRYKKTQKVISTSGKLSGVTSNGDLVIVDEEGKVEADILIQDPDSQDIKFRTSGYYARLIGKNDVIKVGDKQCFTLTSFEEVSCRIANNAASGVAIEKVNDFTNSKFGFNVVDIAENREVFFQQTPVPSGFFPYGFTKILPTYDNRYIYTTTPKDVFVWSYEKESVQQVYNSKSLQKENIDFVGNNSYKLFKITNNSVQTLSFNEEQNKINSDFYININYFQGIFAKKLSDNDRYFLLTGYDSKGKRMTLVDVAKKSHQDFYLKRLEVAFAPNSQFFVYQKDSANQEFETIVIEPLEK